jgi:20S proteasome alpha/beta subunit
MSDSLIGISGDGFVLIAADTAQSRSVLVLKTTEDKITELEKRKMVGGSGPQGELLSVFLNLQ